MKELQLFISEKALDDLLDIWLYVSDGGEQRADRYVQKIQDVTKKLARNPLMGRERDELSPGLRSFPYQNYVIFYRATEDALEVVRILSGYRDIDSIL